MSEEQSENGNSNAEVPEIELIIKVSFPISIMDIAYEIALLVVYFMVWMRPKAFEVI